MLLGVVVTATPRGYGGEMELLIGFDTELRVTGIQFITISESPGIGTLVQEESYWGQYIGQSEFDGVDAITAPPSAPRPSRAALRRLPSSPWQFWHRRCNE